MIAVRALLHAILCACNDGCCVLMLWMADEYGDGTPKQSTPGPKEPLASNICPNQPPLSIGSAMLCAIVLPKVSKRALGAKSCVLFLPSLRRRTRQKNTNRSRLTHCTEQWHAKAEVSKSLKRYQVTKPTPTGNQPPKRTSTTRDLGSLNLHHTQAYCAKYSDSDPLPQRLKWLLASSPPRNPPSAI